MNPPATAGSFRTAIPTLAEVDSRRQLLPIVEMSPEVRGDLAENGIVHIPLPDNVIRIVSTDPVAIGGNMQ